MQWSLPNSLFLWALATDIVDSFSSVSAAEQRNLGTFQGRDQRAVYKVIAWGADAGGQNRNAVEILFDCSQVNRHFFALFQSTSRNLVKQEQPLFHFAVHQLRILLRVIFRNDWFRDFAEDRCL